MSANFKHQTYKIDDFIDLVKAKKDRAKSYDPDYFYDLYGEDGNKGLSLGMEIYISDTVQATDEGEEIYPQEVTDRGLSFLYSNENFQAVIDLAVSQDPDVSTAKIIECLNYYSAKDDFLDVTP